MKKYNLIILISIIVTAIVILVKAMETPDSNGFIYLFDNYLPVLHVSEPDATGSFLIQYKWQGPLVVFLVTTIIQILLRRIKNAKSN